jgi:hypothetical protein
MDSAGRTVFFNNVLYLELINIFVFWGKIVGEWDFFHQNKMGRQSMANSLDNCNYFFDDHNYQYVSDSILDKIDPTPNLGSHIFDIVQYAVVLFLFAYLS